MDILDSERQVIDAAERLAGTLGTDANHSVAAAAMDASGRIHTAVNVYHFTGGYPRRISDDHRTPRPRPIDR